MPWTSNNWKKCIGWRMQKSCCCCLFSSNSTFDVNTKKIQLQLKCNFLVFQSYLEVLKKYHLTSHSLSHGYNIPDVIRQSHCGTFPRSDIWCNIPKVGNFIIILPSSSPVCVFNVWFTCLISDSCCYSLVNVSTFSKKCLVSGDMSWRKVILAQLQPCSCFLCRKQSFHTP